MPKRTVKPEPSWQSKFVREWHTLAKGEADVEELHERASALELKNRHRDPAMVAAEDFAEACRPKRVVIPDWTPPAAMKKSAERRP
ncbi:hypothetical protein [Variovorax paradoxus]|uniref:Uncharacterized protein n=1 Tax=Variovorax paradoxus (strain EPS) TaxID=595537 RepID=E6V3T6_VARPE|nr:hypothetical protein [Variovorax paradoxus]ADU36960.1 hypothetical protein Varpa_2762 [Variovorax paradoxus EPS]